MRCPPFHTAGEAVADALDALMLRALNAALPVLADVQHPSDPQAVAAFVAVQSAIQAAEARP